MRTSDFKEIFTKPPLEGTIAGVRVKELEAKNCRVARMDSPTQDNQRTLAEHYQSQGFEVIAFSMPEGETSPYMVAINPSEQNIKIGNIMPENYPRVDFIEVSSITDDDTSFMFSITGGRKDTPNESITSLHRLAYAFDYLVDEHLMGNLDREALAPLQRLEKNNSWKFSLNFKIFQPIIQLFGASKAIPS